MKSFLVFSLVLVANLWAQVQPQSANWIDLSNKSDAEIIRSLQREIATIALSPADSANDRVLLVQLKKKEDRQTFDQITVLLEGEWSAAAAAMEASEKTIASLQTDSTTLAAQIDMYDCSRQRLRERLEKFAFKAVVVAKADYTSNLELVKERMLFEAGRLAIEQVNGVEIISETLTKNGILASDIIQATTEGKADCQPREWKTIEAGTRRVIYLYGICDVYPLSPAVKLTGQAALLQLAVETMLIKNSDDPQLARLPAVIQKEIRTIAGAAEQANVTVGSNLNRLMQPENHPAVNVTWEEAKAFCEWGGGRLPTEAEWEYAAREGGKKVKFGTAENTLSPREANYDPGNYAEDGYRYTAPVGSFSPNALGLCDMAGNVWEWCQDRYDENYYRNSPTTNPKGPSSGQLRVLRGGSWVNYPDVLRGATRNWNYPTDRDDYGGFRCARDVR